MERSAAAARTNEEDEGWHDLENNLLHFLTPKRGRTGLHQAAVKGDSSEVEMALAGGAKPNTQDAHLQTPITLAAERGLHVIVKLLADFPGTDLNLQDSFGRTPLHWCAKRCDVKGIQTLLATGKASVNVRTTGGDTALHWACSAERGDASDEDSFEERSLRAVELLVAAGGDVRAKNERGEKPSDLVTDDAIVALLLSALQQLERREEEEAAVAERYRASSAQASSGKSNPTGTVGKASPSTGSGWPGRHPSAAMALPKQDNKGLVGAAPNGAKKKIVIKLKKKS